MIFSTYTHTTKTIEVDLCGNLQQKHIVYRFAPYWDFKKEFQRFETGNQDSLLHTFCAYRTGACDTFESCLLRDMQCSSERDNVLHGFGNDDSLEELFSVLFKQYVYELQLYIVLHLQSFRQSMSLISVVKMVWNRDKNNEEIKEVTNLLI